MLSINILKPFFRIWFLFRYVFLCFALLRPLFVPLLKRTPPPFCDLHRNPFFYENKIFSYHSYLIVAHKILKFINCKSADCNLFKVFISCFRYAFQFMFFPSRFLASIEPAYVYYVYAIAALLTQCGWTLIVINKKKKIKNRNNKTSFSNSYYVASERWWFHKAEHSN